MGMWVMIVDLDLDGVHERAVDLDRAYERCNWTVLMSGRSG